ncbi:uncharacterized protein M421DRAFT_422450 [Didymella exigua CBS 183.55]|uniref:Proteasome assembly chaperone 3 n=1 Tax=Didymella exigua CBS 183.55 TaxID=1150837 RepID=A0A6A5REZ7_9PLEO|nr:uncharacterized protein M421DRAFT_422450 [Didymella exigua CBS 183.55]KAF1926845.1 hypothetical protein M421DRAFT_422450 [Didymella exigua CBS 183.55]
MAAETEDYTIRAAPFPARSKTASSSINGKETTATSMSFLDKILITVTQEGRLAHWVHVPLGISAIDAGATSQSYLDRDDEDASSDLLPMHHLTATNVLGGTIPELEVLGQTLATQIASAIKTQNDRETRMVVLGMGLDKSVSGRQEFSELVGLVLEVL